MWIATDHPSAATASIGQRIAAAACIIRDHSNAAASTAKARAANRRRFGLIAAATGRAAAAALNRSAGAVASLGAVPAAYMVAAFARSVARTHRALDAYTRAAAAASEPAKVAPARRGHLDLLVGQLMAAGGRRA